MAKRIFWTGILAMVLVFGIWFTACSTDSGEKYDPIVYTSKDTSGNTYKLTITKNTSKAAFTPANGDNYTLTITYANGTTKTSTGTVASYSSTAITFEGATSATFTVTTTSAGKMTKIEGTITLDDNTTVTAPGAVTPQDNNPGGTAPAANPFANTSWRSEAKVTENGQTATYVLTLSFGTDTWTTIQYKNGQPVEGGQSGTYTASGNTATCTNTTNPEGGTFTATISGNVLTVDAFPTPFTKVN